MGEFQVIKNYRGSRRFTQVGLKIYEGKDKKSSLSEIAFRNDLVEQLGWQKSQKLELSLDPEGQRIRLSGKNPALKNGYTLQRTSSCHFVKFATPEGFPRTLEMESLDKADVTIDKKEKSIILNCASYLSPKDE